MRETILDDPDLARRSNVGGRLILGGCLTMIPAGLTTVGAVILGAWGTDRREDQAILGAVAATAGLMFAGSVAMVTIGAVMKTRVKRDARYELGWAYQRNGGGLVLSGRF